MEKLTKKELISLLHNQGSTPPPPIVKGKTAIEAAKKEEMLIRLAKMRETVAINRAAKKELPVTEQSTGNPPEDVFEKTNSSKFDRMTELLVELNANTKNLTDMKKEKKAEKEKAAAIIAAEKAERAEKAEKDRQTFESQVQQIRETATSQTQAQPRVQAPAQQAQAPVKQIPVNPMAKFTRPKQQMF